MSGAGGGGAAKAHPGSTLGQGSTTGHSSTTRILPGKKGIALSVDQLFALVESLPWLERELEKRGIGGFPRPVFVRGVSVGGAEGSGAGGVTTEENVDHGGGVGGGDCDASTSQKQQSPTESHLAKSSPSADTEMRPPGEVDNDAPPARHPTRHPTQAKRNFDPTDDEDSD